MMRATAALAALLGVGCLVVGAAEAKRQPSAPEPAPPPAPPIIQTPSDYIPVVPDGILRGYSARQQSAILALREGCIAGEATRSAAEKERIEAELLAKLREATSRQRLWTGYLTAREFDGSYASAEVLVAPNISFATASVGWLSMDPLGTRIPVGSQVHRFLVNMHPNTIVLFDFEPVSIFVRGRCSVEMRLLGILPVSR